MTADSPQNTFRNPLAVATTQVTMMHNYKYPVAAFPLHAVAQIQGPITNGRQAAIAAFNFVNDFTFVKLPKAQ